MFVIVMRVVWETRRSAKKMTKRKEKIKRKSRNREKRKKAKSFDRYFFWCLAGIGDSYQGLKL